MKKIKVLIVDDSALIRKILTEIINNQHDMEVVGAARDPLIAREMIRELKPDVLTLDIEMPKMNGLDFLERLMRLRPMPVIMISTITEKAPEVVFRALELGAVDFIAKPKIDIVTGLMQYSEKIAEKIRIGMRTRVRQPRSEGLPRCSSVDVVSPLNINPVISPEKLIFVGASTGGPEAVKEFLIQLPPDCPGILIVQHMSEIFTRSFAKRLNNLCSITVTEAQGGEPVLPGRAFIAPGHSHLLLKRHGADYFTELRHGELVNHHRPSVDVLFCSAANVAGKNAVGVMLTGMGKDGASGMLKMRQAGAYNFAQNEESCVVYGMPKEAVSVGAVDEIIPLSEMAKKVLLKVSGIEKPSRKRQKRNNITR